MEKIDNIDRIIKIHCIFTLIFFLLGSLLILSFAFYALHSIKDISNEIIYRENTEKSCKFIFIELPKSYLINVETTAYSSTVDQTDSTPFITASGTTVRDGIVACNFLPFGTKIKFPEIYGDKIFIVEDRMNSRYTNNRIDIWFQTREESIDFGIKMLKVEILMR